ncbi:MAG TPA: four-carbon acid sugar kinase family protein [Flavisolibacter sp.]|nr:four-carbon acid sugar kinase family protein [Flavisolibacter sp.]
MIVVIADDITGAAEIGGIGLRYGLKVLLSNDVTNTSGTDLLVVYTNTRSLPEAEAVKEMAMLTGKAVQLHPSLFYKKTDSVLRGHVLAEMKVQMEVLGFTKALLLPVNPLLGRTIQKGIYYVNGKPVHEAGFANDPEFPISNSAVEKMLGASKDEIKLSTVSEHLSDGITVGEASTMQEVKEWAAAGDNNILYAGAASFFSALLRQRFVAKKMDTKPALSAPLLLVSGTTYQQSIQKQAAYQEHLCSMPAEVFSQPEIESNTVQIWAERVISQLRKTGKCIMTVGPQEGLKTDSGLLREKLSAAVAEVVKAIPLKELLVEGGATSFSIIQKLGFTAFEPTEELQQGVVRMKVAGQDNLHVTIKPGSYAWPVAWEQAFAD